MADKKIEKALYGPSTLEVAIGALLGLLLGVLVACVYLVLKPVQVAKEPPKEPERGTVYLLTGRTDSVKGAGWQAKQIALINGGQVALSEEELNAWALSVAKGAAKDKPAPAGEEFITATGLNFRLEGDRLHVSQRVQLSYYGISKEVILQSEGGFERHADAFVYKPQKVFLGSCPLHAIPGATGALMRSLVAKQHVSDEVRAAWAKISAIAVDGNLLNITTQP